jgi:beta-galactosidase
MPTFSNPSQLLDWRRFGSDTLIELFQLERDILRRHAPGVPITTNFLGMYPPIDYWKMAAEEDVVSQDSYPDPFDTAGSTSGAAAVCDLVRSLGAGRPWILMEQAASSVQWRARNGLKRPGQMRAQSLQAVGRGADGVMFFQWRQSVRGAERFHSGMVPHAGTDTRVWREIEGLGADLARLEPLIGTTGDSRGGHRVRLGVLVVASHRRPTRSGRLPGHRRGSSPGSVGTLDHRRLRAAVGSARPVPAGDRARLVPDVR